jgi:hypothetical protein
MIFIFSVLYTDEVVTAHHCTLSAKEFAVLFWNALSMYVQTDENLLACSVTYILDLTSSSWLYLVLSLSA